MSLHFNADGILRMAEQIERNGEAFYRSAAARIPDGAVKDRLLELAAMEAQHQTTFGIVRNMLVSEEPHAPPYDPRGQTEMYLQDLAERHIFAKETPTELLAACLTPEEVLDVALRFERESVSFYTGLQSLVPAALGRGNVELIVDEEREHVAILEAEKQRLVAARTGASSRNA